jgi:predicted AlkP superfamily phosphohydrolase/phosphomutase
MTNQRYNILCKGRRIYSSLTEEEYFNVMEDLSIEFYQTGSPNPEDIETEILLENNVWQQKQKSV